MLVFSSAVAFADAVEQSQKSLAPRAMRVLAAVRKLQEQAGNAKSKSEHSLETMSCRWGSVLKLLRLPDHADQAALRHRCGRSGHLPKTPC